MDERIERIKRIMGTEFMPARLREGWSPVPVTDEMVSAYVNANGGEEPEVRQGLEAVFRLMGDERSPVVLVSRELWESMRKDVTVLRRLESAGVDNWSGYDSAMEPIWAAEDEAHMFRGK